VRQRVAEEARGRRVPARFWEGKETRARRGSRGVPDEETGGRRTLAAATRFSEGSKSTSAMVTARDTFVEANDEECGV